MFISGPFPPFFEYACALAYSCLNVIYCGEDHYTFFFLDNRFFIAFCHNTCGV